MIDSVTDINVLEHLPHRDPFLFVDKVLEINCYKDIVTEKLITADEPYLTGHFPGRPIMPGVLMVEALAQSAGILIHYSLGTKPEANQPYFLASIKQARFKRLVLPNDKLTMRVDLEKHRDVLWQFTGTIHVGSELAVEATFINMRSV